MCFMTKEQDQGVRFRTSFLMVFVAAVAASGCAAVSGDIVPGRIEHAVCHNPSRPAYESEDEAPGVAIGSIPLSESAAETARLIHALPLRHSLSDEPFGRRRRRGHRRRHRRSRCRIVGARGSRGGHAQSRPESARGSLEPVQHLDGVSAFDLALSQRRIRNRWKSPGCSARAMARTRTARRAGFSRGRATHTAVLRRRRRLYDR
jgi:hypothetical protein